jgi:phage protein U
VFREKSNIVVFIGDIDFTDEELPKTLKHVSGKLSSESRDVTLPQNLEHVGRHFTLRKLQEIPKEGLDLQNVTIGGDLYLYSLTSAEGLVLPETVGGNLNLRSLESAKGLVLPETIGGDLYLYSLTPAEGLVLPKTIGGDLDLRSLKSAEGLVLPEAIGGRLNLRSLTSAEGLEKLNYASITGGIYLPKAFSAKERAKVEKIKTKQKEKGINVNFEYL